MEELFLVAKKIVSNLQSTLSNKREAIGNYYFEYATIKSASFEICFSKSIDKIYLTLSTHHLDMPWKIEIVIFKASVKIDFGKLMRKVKMDERLYEVFPNLMRSPNELGNELGRVIEDDIINYLIENKE